jgi:meso-butanediol dehydrogenase/(S,S)-butanediol dehydrogenase/diacetyl reductase
MRITIGQEWNMGTVKGKSVILTGGAGEIAREVAAQFLAGGAQVLLVDVNEAALQQAVASLGGSSVAYCVADVTSEDDTVAYVRKALETFGRLDVLVANAGVEGLVAPVSEYDTDAFRRLLDINVVGYSLASNMCSRHWRHRVAAAL